jgi:hypothetical protein
MNVLVGQLLDPLLGGSAVPGGSGRRIRLAESGGGNHKAQASGRHGSFHSFFPNIRRAGALDRYRLSLAQNGKKL